MKPICRGLLAWSIFHSQIDVGNSTSFTDNHIQTLITNKQLIQSHLIDGIHIGLMKGKQLQIEIRAFQSVYFLQIGLKGMQ